MSAFTDLYDQFLIEGDPESTAEGIVTQLRLNSRQRDALRRA